MRPPPGTQQRPKPFHCIDMDFIEAIANLLVEIGWQNGRRIYGTLLHIDIIDQKLWIQQDGIEEGIADELVALGVPKQQIVLGFKPIDRRKVTEFAI